jgi:hypothetical protein
VRARAASCAVEIGNRTRMVFADADSITLRNLMPADFAVVPMGLGDGVKKLIAEALKIVDESGLSYKLGAM